MSMTALPTETDFQTERGDCSSPPCVRLPKPPPSVPYRETFRPCDTYPRGRPTSENQGSLRASHHSVVDIHVALAVHLILANPTMSKEKVTGSVRHCEALPLIMAAA
jgi:hypothetical protein